MLTLIVEDDELTRMLFQSFLIGFGKCDLAEDGSHGIKRFMDAHSKNEPYDLVCLDLMMPEVDGLEVLDMIRNYERENQISDDDRVRVVMTTAVTNPDTIQKAYDAKCDGYLIKPIVRATLLDEVKKLGLSEK